jgi:sugar lactone lactonase YvrE
MPSWYARRARTIADRVPPWMQISTRGASAGLRREDNMFRRLVHAAMVAFVMTGTAYAQTTPPVEKYELPANVTFPEGIAYDPAANAFYTASAVTGTLVRVNAKTKASEVVAAAGVLVPGGLTTTFPAVLGMKVDSQSRLWIAGGRSGKIFIVDTRSGKVQAQLDVPEPTKSLINDVTLIGTTAYFTDTRVPTLWRVEAKGDKIGALEPWLNFTDTPLQYFDGANLNGITATPNGQTLIVVQMGKGLLYKIDVKTKVVTPIDTSGADLTGADGLVLDGSTLYVVRQTAVEIATVKLSQDLSKGTVVARFKDPALAWPATAAKVGDRLLVVNSQFNVREAKKETLPFAVSAVPLSRLAGK